MTGRLVVYASAAVLVRLADEGARVVLALLALQRTGSAALGGALVAALLVPHVLAAPVVGLLVDRVRRPQVIIALAALVFGMALAATTVALGRVPVSLVIGLLLAGGCCGPALTGALSSQLPGLVGDRGLARAGGLDSLTYNTAGIIGPALGALFAGVSSPAGGTYALATSATLGSVLIVGLRTRARPAAASPVRATDLLAGVKIMLHDRVLAAVTAATSLGQFGLGALPVMAAVLAARRHNPAASGLLLTSLAAGGVLGSLAWTWRPAAAERAARVVMQALVGVGVPLLAAAGFNSLTAITALFALSGYFNGPLFGALLTTRQQRAPTQLHSQVFTLGAGAKITAAAAGAAVAGQVSGLPSALQLLIAASCPILAGSLGSTYLRRQHPPVPRTSNPRANNASARTAGQNR